MLRKVNGLLENYDYVEKVEILLQDMQEIAGRYAVFTGPTVLLFYNGKEILRESRFISLENLERTIQLIYYFHTIICCSCNNLNSSSIKQKEGKSYKTK